MQCACCEGTTVSTIVSVGVESACRSSQPQIIHVATPTLRMAISISKEHHVIKSPETAHGMHLLYWDWTTLCLKNYTAVAHYIFDADQPILIVFSR